MSIDVDDNVVKTYNQTFSDITRDYLYVTNILHNNEQINRLTSNNTIEFNDIVDFECALNNLAVHIQNIKFKLMATENRKLEQITQAIPNQNQQNQLSKEQDLALQTDKMLNKTINEVLPLFMLHLMNNDPNSILNKNPALASIKSTMEQIQSASNNFNITKKPTDPFNPDDLD
jgi:hypothetical protein